MEGLLNKVTAGNCLDILKDIPDKSINLVATDPPYCVGTTSNGLKGSRHDNVLIVPFFESLLAEFARVLKDDGEFYINTDWRTYPLLYYPVVENLAMRNLIVWDYEWIKAGNFYRFSNELILYGTKSDKAKRKFAPSERDVWRIRPINFSSPDKLHSSQKPVALMEKMILNSTKEGDIVLDCFLGSGTTAIACINTKRNYIGIEIDSAMRNIANNRISEHQKQQTLSFM